MIYLIPMGANWSKEKQASRFARTIVVLAVWLLGCRNEMYNQPKHEPLETSLFFNDRMSARPLVNGTVPRGWLKADDAYYKGLAGANLVARLPVALTLDLIERGQERYNIYCSPCHGLTGSGSGMIVQHGFPQPPSFHSDRLRDAPIGYFYYVATYGYGVMYPYAARVTPEERWAISAYIRALQASQSAGLKDLPPDIRAQLASEAK